MQTTVRTAVIKPYGKRKGRKTGNIKNGGLP